MMMKIVAFRANGRGPLIWANENGNLFPDEDNELTTSSMAMISLLLFFYHHLLPHQPEELPLFITDLIPILQ